MDRLRGCIRRCTNLHPSAPSAPSAPPALSAPERPTSSPAIAWDSVTRNQEDRDFGRRLASRRPRLLSDASDDEDPLALVASATPKLRPEDVGFFDPDYQEKDKKTVNHLAPAPVVSADKHVFYRDVYAFTDRLLDLAKQHGNEAIENVITACFRGTALMWYSMEVDDSLRNLFRDAKLDT